MSGLFGFTNQGASAALDVAINSIFTVMPRTESSLLNLEELAGDIRSSFRSMAYGFHGIRVSPFPP